MNDPCYRCEHKSVCLFADSFRDYAAIVEKKTDDIHLGVFYAEPRCRHFREVKYEVV